MATYYWVGGTGTWNASSTTNWASSSGGAGGAGVPTAADNVIIDNNSGTGTITCTGASATCLDLTVTATQALVVSGNNSLLYGSLTLPSSGSLIFSVTLAFTATTTGKTITTNGKAVSGAWTFLGAGGEWTLGSAVVNSLSITLRTGTFNTGNFNVQCSQFIVTTSGVRSLNLGSSTITLTSFGWNLANSVNLTFNAGTSTILHTATSGVTFNGGGLTYYNVTFSIVNTNASNDIVGANTYNNLTLNMNTASANICSYSIDSNQTVNGTLSINGSTYTKRIYVKSAVPSVQKTITAATVAMAYTDFTDIVGAGTGSWTGTSIGNAQNNSGITFDTAKTVYWNLTGTQNWTATGWALTSGGTPLAANFPLAQDTVIFDNTGSVTGTITVSNAWNIGTLDMSARTSAMTLSMSTTTRFYGSFTAGTGVTLAGGGPVTFTGRSTQTVTSNGVSFAPAVTIDSGIGTLSFSGSLTTTGTFSLTSGTLNLANNTLTCNAFTINAVYATAIQFGTGNITIIGTGTVINGAGSLFTYTGTPTINVSNNSATATAISLTSGFTQSNALNINYTTGTYTLTDTSAQYGNVNFTGFAGTVSNTARTVFGNWTIPASGITWGGGTQITTFARTSGTQTITTNGTTILFPITINGVGGTTQLADDLTLATTRALTLTNGTFDANNKNVTIGSFVSTNTNVRTLNMGSGTWGLVNSGTVWNCATTTNFTLNPSTSTIVLSNTTTTARTFAGGGLTYNNLVIGGTTGISTLTFTGSNTFNTISSTKTVAHTILFTASTTTTVTNFTVSGTSGNVVTIGSVTAASHTLAKAGGGTITVDYASISRSTATPTLTWLATNSTDGGNNSGWYFGAFPSPSTNSGRYFLLF